MQSGTCTHNMCSGRHEGVFNLSDEDKRSQLTSNTHRASKRVRTQAAAKIGTVWLRETTAAYYHVCDPQQPTPSQQIGTAPTKVGA